MVVMVRGKDPLLPFLVTMQRVWGFLGIDDPLARHVFFWGFFARIALTLIGDALDKIGSSSRPPTPGLRSCDQIRCSPLSVAGGD